MKKYIKTFDGDFFAEDMVKSIEIMPGFTLKIISYLDNKWFNLN